MLVANANSQRAAEVAERVRHALENAVIPGHPDIKITSSFGVAEATNAVLDVEDWSDRADAQLYAAKESGRNRVHVANDALPQAAMMN
jgi:diguanylate cyclase (GGDEF)-like protein